MINSEHDTSTGGTGSDDVAVTTILRSGAKGAVVLAGIATAIVIGIWFAFYFLVFLPRGGAS